MGPCSHMAVQRRAEVTRRAPCSGRNRGEAAPETPKPAPWHGFQGGRYWARTSDLRLVEAAQPSRSTTRSGDPLHRHSARRAGAVGCGLLRSVASISFHAAPRADCGAALDACRRNAPGRRWRNRRVLVSKQVARLLQVLARHRCSCRSVRESAVDPARGATFGSTYRLLPSRTSGGVRRAEELLECRCPVRPASLPLRAGRALDAHGAAEWPTWIRGEDVRVAGVQVGAVLE